MRSFEALANTPERREIRNAIRALCNKFDDNYWAEKDRLHEFPHEFANAVAVGGRLGIAMPLEFGGSGMGVIEASVMMQEIGRSAGSFAACSAVHINIFGLQSIVKHGSNAQRRKWLPSIIDGSCRACFGVTEPDAGLDTSNIKTQALRTGDRYIVNGQKVWTSGAEQAAKIVLLARTTPIEQCERPIDGLSLFYADLDRSTIEIREIQKMGRHAVDSNQLFFDNRNPGRSPDRRGRKRLLLPSRQSEPRAHSQRGGGRRDRPAGAGEGSRLRQRTRRLWPQDRAKSIDPAPASGMLVRLVRRRTNHSSCGRAIRFRPILRHPGECCEVSRRGRWVSCL